MPSDRLQRWAGILAVLNLAMIAIILGRPSFSNASRPVRGLTNPVLAMEVAQDVAEVDSILGEAPSPDREVMRIKQYADFGFIACYAALYAVMSLLLLRDGRRAVAITAGALGVLAAICDVVENIGILHVVDTSLSHTTQALIDGIRYPSLIKWTLASISIGLLAILLMRSHRIGLRIVGALNLCAALLGLYGLVDNVFLQWAGLPMLGGLMGLAILYFRPRWYTIHRNA